VVDDGSDDDTADIVARRFGYGTKLLRLPRRGGVGAARNIGVSEASGELIAFLDSDDLWSPGKLEAELRVFADFPDAESIISDSLTFMEGWPSERSRFAMNGLLAATNRQVRWLNECPWLWGHWNSTVPIGSITLRRSMIDRLGEPLFPEDVICGEDWALEMRVYHACRVIVLPEVWAYIRRFDDGTRPGRACPGKPATFAQTISMWRDKLTILERTLELRGLSAEIVAELDLCRNVTAQQLSSYQNSEAT
jgi:glycosyltransferase involved in cell wall biosynthesis